MTKPKRICVKCGDPLGDQMFKHFSTKQQYTNTHSTDKWTYRCYGPRETPGAPESRRASTSLPIHHREIGNYDITSCGLRPGRTHGKYRSEGAQVTWSRVSTDMRDVSCVECLVVLSSFLTRRAEAAMKVGRREIKEIMEKVQTRRMMHGLEKLVVNG